MSSSTLTRGYHHSLGRIEAGEKKVSKGDADFTEL